MKKGLLNTFILIFAIFISCGYLHSQPVLEVIDQRSNDNTLVSAVSLFNQEKYDQAIKLLKVVIDNDPNYDAAYYYIARSYMAIGEVEQAECQLLKAIELSPDNYWYRYWLSFLYSRTDQIEDAITTAQDLLSSFPRKSDIYMYLVELYIQSNQFDKALETLKEVDIVFGPAEYTTIFRHRLLMSLGRKDEAIAYLKEYNSKYSSPMVLSILGEMMLSEYEIEEAEKYYNESLEFDSEYFPALIGMAELYRMQAKFDQYFPTLIKCLSLENSAEDKADYLRTMIAEDRFLYRHINQLDTCVSICLQKHPQDTAVLTMGSIFYYKTNRGEKSLDLLKSKVELYPDEKESWSEYLYVADQCSMYDEMIAASKEAQKRFPEIDLYDIYELSGYVSKEDDENFILKAQAILKKHSNNIEIQYRINVYIAEYYHRNGMSKQTFAHYEKALKYKPDDLYILNNYAYFLSLEKKNLKKAYQMSKKTIEAEPDNATYLDTFAWILYLRGMSVEAKSVFKHAMLYGGKDSAVIMDHYAEVLYSLEEYDMAFLYWNKAKMKNKGEIPDLEERIKKRKDALKKK